MSTKSSKVFRFGLNANGHHMESVSLLDVIGVIFVLVRNSFKITISSSSRKHIATSGTSLRQRVLKVYPFSDKVPPFLPLIG